MDVDCGMYSTFMQEDYTFIEKLSTIMENREKSCPRMRFLCFRLVFIADGYNLSDQMEGLIILIPKHM